MEGNTSQQKQEMEDPAFMAVPATNEGVDPSVTFINEEVLNAKAEPFTGSAKLIADQAAAMMVQDVRGFMQGNQQFLILATAKAISKTLSQNPAERAAGAEALTQIAKTQVQLTKFTADVGTIAAKITTDFNHVNAEFGATPDLYQTIEIVESEDGKDVSEENQNQ